MRPELAKAIDVGRSLAWMPAANLGGSRASCYRTRKERHEELRQVMARVGRPRGASDELRFLVDALRRVANASFANRMGLPYYERRQAVAELRGCLDTYDRSVAA